jgi:hypothetical protein
MSDLVGNVRALKALSKESSDKVKEAAKAASMRTEVAEGPGAPPVTVHPGVERWPVKTGTDADVSKVGRNVVNGADLGQGVVVTTVEEMRSFKRAADMPAVTASFAINSPYQDHRAAPVETTIWQLTALVTKARLEQDGDYHLVLQGKSNVTMIGEIPKPDPAFVKNAAWRAAIEKARTAMDQKVGHPLAAVGFHPESVAPPTKDRFSDGAAPPETVAPMTDVNAQAIITGVGLFDSSHGQVGVAPSAIEIHPIFDIKFI